MIGSADESTETIDICVGGVPLCGLLIDSGAMCYLIDRMTWEELKQKQKKCKSQCTTKKMAKTLHSSVVSVKSAQHR